MKKLAILSPLVLLATTALAQDSTCILQPSCSQLGYTSAEADCGTAKVLRCPFDVSQVACVGGTGNEDGEYNPNDPNNEFGDAVVIELKAKAETNSFGYRGNIVVDCGNDTFYRGGSGSGIGLATCKYTTAGSYIVKIYGNYTELRFDRAESGNREMRYSVLYFLKLNKKGLKSLTNMCTSSALGFLPPLPSSLEDGKNAFLNCSALSGVVQDFSTLPNLASYTDMFTGSGITNANNPTWPAEAW
ncbi:MAG: hypothetical protein IJV97_01960 [Alphaproteobacteria bacterium]|nr:hypothetical protein [Alphaproteobacteria bacterium]